MLDGHFRRFSFSKRRQVFSRTCIHFFLAFPLFLFCPSVTSLNPWSQSACYFKGVAVFRTLWGYFVSSFLLLYLGFSLLLYFLFSQFYIFLIVTWIDTLFVICRKLVFPTFVCDIYQQTNRGQAGLSCTLVVDTPPVDDAFWRFLTPPLSMTHLPVNNKGRYEDRNDNPDLDLAKYISSNLFTIWPSNF